MTITPELQKQLDLEDQFTNEMAEAHERTQQMMDAYYSDQELSSWIQSQQDAYYAHMDAVATDPTYREGEWF